jgi:hypothetical protein
MIVLPGGGAVRDCEKKGMFVDPVLEDGCPGGGRLTGMRPGKGMGIEVSANQSGNGKIEWKGEEGVKGMCVGGDVMIERK